MYIFISIEVVWQEGGGIQYLGPPPEYALVWMLNELIVSLFMSEVAQSSLFTNHRLQKLDIPMNIFFK